MSLKQTAGPYRAFRRRRRGTAAAAGFTLVEMAVVLVILGLLVGGLIMPMAMQVEKDKRRQTETALNALRDALIGYAIAHQTLPCPDTDGDGQPDACATGSGNFSIGAPPWALLGQESSDTWGGSYRYAVNGAYTDPGNPISYSTAGTGSGRLLVHEGAGCTGNQRADNVAAVILSGAKTDYGNALEQENRDADRCFVGLDYSTVSGGEFDDLVSWVSPPVLLSRLAAAGRL